MRKTNLIGLALFAGLLVLAGTTAAKDTAAAAGADAKPAVVVGTFDSRAVAVAWVRSPEFSEYVAAQRKDVDAAVGRAKAAGDTALVRDLEALGPEMQRRVHRQSFGTAPVDDVIARIADRLPAVAADAGVDVIVSKWTLTWRAPEATFVDVTDRLVDEFHPDDATRKVIRDLVTTAPLSPEAIGRHE